METNSTLNTAVAAEAQSTGIKPKAIGIIGIVGILAVFPALHFAMGGSLNFQLHLLLFTFMYISMASSWNIIGGYAGYISLGHNVFFAIGAYIGGVLLAMMGVPLIISAPLAGIATFLVGLLVGFITLRVHGPSFIISTVALVLVIRILLDNWDFIGGANGMPLPLIDLPVIWSKIPFYYAFLVIACLTVYMSYRIRHSKLGIGLRAISQDEVKAESAGIPTNMYKIIAYALSGTLIGVCGAVYGQYINYLQPSIFLVILIGAQLVLMNILGGKGTVAGPVIGAILIIGVNELILSNFAGSELNIFGTGAIMAVVLLFFPDGIVGSLRSRGWLPGILDWD